MVTYLPRVLGSEAARVLCLSEGPAVGTARLKMMNNAAWPGVVEQGPAERMWSGMK